VNFVEVNGTALRYDLLGSGAATLVLIHEMGGTLESWELVAPMLSAKRRVLRYDTRGAGLSQKIRPPLAIDSMVDDLVALMDTLRIAGKVALAGTAFGGAIALLPRRAIRGASQRRSSAALPSALLPIAVPHRLPA
jgi:3-oxoadipate enol-lactonase